MIRVIEIIYYHSGNVCFFSQKWTDAYNLINNFSIIACGARPARSCATAYLLRGAHIPYALGSFALIENYFIRL